ncbi:MAG TPA: SAM-dependent methyltransferase [Vicinamibacteria bacterium]|nr:SAM-dependent methyltransferase [Vicinamibacteria bacterium]
MRAGRPSRTALAAAIHRAEHQVLEHGRIFSDPLALRILGRDAETIARHADPRPGRRLMRLFIAFRTRFAEEALAAALERGFCQVVILGAGLDTYACRSASLGGQRVFEVDHPATQEWKRARLAAAGIELPRALTFAPVDFERETLDDGLAAAGFERGRRAFFTWLGVVPYLTEKAIASTLGFIGGLPGGAHVVFDYSNPPDSFAPRMRAAHDARAARLAELGESLVTYFETAALHARLGALGFSTIEDLSPVEIASRCSPDQALAPARGGGHVLHASTARDA